MSSTAFKRQLTAEKCPYQKKTQNKLFKKPSKLYQRYDDHQYDQPQISKLDRPRHQVEFEKRLKSPKVNISKLKIFDETFDSNSSESSLHCATTTVNPINPLHLDFQGGVHQERVRGREQKKQNAKEYNRVKKYLDKVDLRKKEKQKLLEITQCPSPLIFDINVPDIISDQQPTAAQQNLDLSCASVKTKLKAFVVRTRDKANIKTVLEKEHDIRVARVQTHLQKCREKEERRKAEEAKRYDHFSAYLPFYLLEKEYEDYFKRYYELNVQKNLSPDKQPKQHREKRERKKWAQMKVDFLERLGRPHKIPQARIDESDSAEYISKQSTDSYDGLSVGQKTSSRFQVRGIHEQSGRQAYGLNIKKEQPVSTCLTRLGWFPQTTDEVINKKKIQLQPISKNIESKNFRIFKKEFKTPKAVEISPIVQHIRGGDIPHQRPINHTILAEPQNLISDTVEAIIKICPVKPQRIFQPNVGEPKTDYTKRLKLRRHHPVKDHSHHQKVLVRYLPRRPLAKKGTVEPDIPCDFGGKKEMITLDYSKTVKESLAMPLYIHYGAPQHQNSEQQVTVQKKQEPELNLFDAQPLIKQESQTIETIENEPKIISAAVKKVILGFKSKYTDEEAELIEQLEKEAASADSCCSSEDESTSLVDYINDSGSHIMVIDQKIPMTFFFRENSGLMSRESRHHVAVEKILASAEQSTNPYRVQAGRLFEVQAACKPDDKFHTFATRKRLNNDHSPTKRVIKKKILRRINDWDEYYLKEIKNRPRLENFKRIQAAEKLHYFLRQRFTLKFMEEYLLFTQMRETDRDSLIREATTFAEMCQKVLSKWQYYWFKRSQRALNNVQPMQKETIRMKEELEAISSKSLKVNTTVIELENEWIRLLSYQKFLYSLMPYHWRLKHDWFHIKADGTLEDPKEAFYNRLKNYIRPRTEQTGLAVYKFYTEHYLLGKWEPPIIVFQNRQKFLNSLILLKQHCFAGITELKCQDILTDTSAELMEYNNWCLEYLTKREETVKSWTERKLSMLAESESMKVEAQKWLNLPMMKAVSFKLTRQLKGWLKVLAESMTGSRFIIWNPLDCFARIVEKVHSLLRQLDVFPAHITIKVDRQIRKRRKSELLMAERGNVEKKRITSAVHHLERSMEPPYQKPARIGKLPRSNQPVRVQKPALPQRMTERERLIYAAFTKNIDALNLKESNFDTEMQKIVQKLEKDCISTDYDQILEMPCTDGILTEVEDRDGPEESLFYFEDVLPDVARRIQVWQQKRETAKKAEIKRIAALLLNKIE